MAEPRPIQKSSDPRLDWRQINNLTESNRLLESKVNLLSSAVTELRLARDIWQAGGGTGTVQELKLTLVANDHYICIDRAGVTVNVAKPYKLRRTPFDGQVIAQTDEQNRTYSALYEYLSPLRRKVTIAQVVEYQVIIPRYRAVTDRIYAIEVDGGTEVVVDDRAVTLLDINADGRAWARER